MSETEMRCGIYWNNLPSGGMLAEDIIDRPKLNSMPMLHMDVSTTVWNTLAHNKIAQTFFNASTDLVEAKYMFPLYGGCAVSSCVILLNEERIECKVMSKDKAAREYDEREKKGETVFHVAQNAECKDLFQIQLGNIPPFARVEITLTVIHAIDMTQNLLHFLLPAKISPRYCSQKEREDLTTHLSLSPTSPLSPLSPPSLFTWTGNFLLPSKVLEIYTPSHANHITLKQINNHDDKPSHTTLQIATNTPPHDLHLTLSLSSHSLPSLLLSPLSPLSHLSHLTHLSLLPNFASTIPPANVEIIFLLDRSGSMAGKKILQVQKTLPIFFRSLQQGVLFNVISFGSTNEVLFPENLPYNESSLQQALLFSQSLSANMGGTELCAALERAYSLPFSPDRRRSVFVLTDGEITDQSRAFGLAGNAYAKDGTRTFALGVGDGVSTSLIRGLARMGNGDCRFVLEGEESGMSGAVIALLGRAFFHSIQNVRVQWVWEEGEEGEERRGEEREERREERWVDLSPVGNDSTVSQIGSTSQLGSTEGMSLCDLQYATMISPCTSSVGGLGREREGEEGEMGEMGEREELESVLGRGVDKNTGMVLIPPEYPPMHQGCMWSVYALIPKGRKLKQAVVRAIDASKKELSVKITAIDVATMEGEEGEKDVGEERREAMRKSADKAAEQVKKGVQREKSREREERIGERGENLLSQSYLSFQNNNLQLLLQAHVGRQLIQVLEDSYDMTHNENERTLLKRVGERMGEKFHLASQWTSFLGVSGKTAERRLPVFSMTGRNMPMPCLMAMPMPLGSPVKAKKAMTMLRRGGEIGEERRGEIMAAGEVGETRREMMASGDMGDVRRERTNYAAPIEESCSIEAVLVQNDPKAILEAKSLSSEPQLSSEKDMRLESALLPNNLKFDAEKLAESQAFPGYFNWTKIVEKIVSPVQLGDLKKLAAKYQCEDPFFVTLALLFVLQERKMELHLLLDQLSFIIQKAESWLRVRAEAIYLKNRPPNPMEEESGESLSHNTHQWVLTLQNEIKALMEQKSIDNIL